MSVRHCAATTAPRNCCPNCCAEQSHNVRSSAVGKQLKQEKSNSVSIAQHHLPALDLFWASFYLRVQLTSLLLILPAFCKQISMVCNFVQLLNLDIFFMLQETYAVEQTLKSKSQLRPAFFSRRHTERQRQRDRQTETERDRDRKTEAEKDRKTETQT